MVPAQHYAARAVGSDHRLAAYYGAAPVDRYRLFPGAFAIGGIAHHREVTGIAFDIHGVERVAAGIGQRIQAVGAGELYHAAPGLGAVGGEFGYLYGVARTDKRLICYNHVAGIGAQQLGIQTRFHVVFGHRHAVAPLLGSVAVDFIHISLPGAVALVGIGYIYISGGIRSYVVAARPGRRSMLRHIYTAFAQFRGAVLIQQLQFKRCV